MYRNDCIWIDGSVSRGNAREFQIAFRGAKFHPIKNATIEIGYGLQAHMLSDKKARLLPSSRRLRNYQAPDLLNGEDIRIWSVSLVVGVNWRINKYINLIILPEIASVNAGNTLIFQYETKSNPELYSKDQDAKPSPSGLINPILRLKGSLQLFTGLQIRLHRKIFLNLSYTQARYEYTTYKLLNFKNDRFMKTMDLWGIGISYRLGLGRNE